MGLLRTETSWPRLQAYLTVLGLAGRDFDHSLAVERCQPHRQYVY